MSTAAAARKTFYDFSVNNLSDGKPIDLSKFRDKVVIVVNGATYCGYTKASYSGLSSLLDKYYADGLRVLISPCNQFMNQEKDDDATVCSFITKQDTRFLTTEKLDVNGSNAHPLWTWLKKQQGGFLFDAIKWNFTKFLIDKQGMAVARFAPNDEPAKMESKIKELLAK